MTTVSDIDKKRLEQRLLELEAKKAEISNKLPASNSIGARLLLAFALGMGGFIVCSAILLFFLVVLEWSASGEEVRNWYLIFAGIPAVLGFLISPVLIGETYKKQLIEIETESADIHEKLGRTYPAPVAYTNQQIKPGQTHIPAVYDTTMHPSPRSAMATPQVSEKAGQLEAELKKAKSLFDEGLLTEDEYQEVRKKLIGHL